MPFNEIPQWRNIVILIILIGHTVIITPSTAFIISDLGTRLTITHLNKLLIYQFSYDVLHVISYLVHRTIKLIRHRANNLFNSPPLFCYFHKNRLRIF